MGRKRVFESFVPSDSEDSDDGDLKEHKHHDATWGNEELTATDSSEGVQSDVFFLFSLFTFLSS